MAKFEIEVSDEIAEEVRTIGRHCWGSVMECLLDALPLLYARDRAYRQEPMEPAQRRVMVMLFARLGRTLDSDAGHNRCFVSLEERGKRTEKAKRAHATRTKRREEGLPTDAATERAARHQRDQPPPGPNVVTLFPPRPGTPTRSWPEG